MVANAFLKIEGNRKSVQHLDGGIVKELRVQEDRPVKAGDVLIVLDETQAKAEHEVLSQQFVVLRATEVRLLAELAAIRARGFAIDDEERNRGMRCIAAAIFDENGEAVAGLSISGPSGRLDPDRIAALGPEVRAAAERITRAIGGTAPHAAGS